MGKKKSFFREFLARLRKQRIIETLAAFVGGGWLLLEFVHWLLVDHYHFPEKSIDITFVTILGALLCTLLLRWFGGRERPRKFKPELFLVPLVLLITLGLDINLLLHLKGPESETFPAAKWKNSIAVLPFVDMSPQKDQEYFCDGMTEDLINRLSNIRELKVPARTSAFMFKGKTPDMHDVGEKLKVATVLEGSIQKSENRLRITAQLINIADGYHLWSEKYDRELKDVFAIQDEISAAIVNALKMKLTPEENRRMSERPISNATAYECYLRASYEMSRLTEDGLNRALQYLHKGIEIIGENALLYACLAETYRLYVDVGLKQEDYISKAEEHVKKALALDPDIPKAHVVLGSINRDFRGNPQEAIRHYKRALAVDPNESGALTSLIFCYFLAGRTSASRLLAERTKRVDPLNDQFRSSEVEVLIFEGQFRLASEKYRKLYQSDPESLKFQMWYSLILMYNNQREEAFSIIDRIVKANPNQLTGKSLLLLEYGLLREEKKAFELMTPDFYRWCKRDAYYSYWAAAVFALLDKRKEALDWLENAVQRGFINYPFLNEYDPFLANLRTEERFKKLMERVKYEWEHFEV